MPSTPAGREAPPLRTFSSLNDDLRRERRVFTTVIALLVCATVAAAAFAVRARVQALLSTEEHIAHLYDQSLADKILDRQGSLTVASLILSLHANGALQDRPAHPDLPCLLPRLQRVDPVLQASCDDVTEILSSDGDRTPIEMIRIDDGTAYVHQPSDEKEALPPANAALARRILDQFETAQIDLSAAAKDERVLWFPASAVGRQTNEMIGASIVARGAAPYALVLTSINLAEIYAASLPSEQEPRPLLLGTDGLLIVGAGSREEAERINALLAPRADGVYHWIPSYGWALRRPPPVSGFGHTLLLLPYREQLAEMRNELLLIAAIAAALIALLLTTYRYWNYRFLSRIYAEAWRALESETLNRLLVHATPVGLCIVRRSALDIIVANPIARNTLGIGPNDTRLPDALRRKFDALGTGPASDGEPAISQFSFAIRRPPDDEVRLEINCVPATLHREAVFFCAITDITERHRAEQMLREAKSTAEATTRAKLAFFASMSHEIRTPLASLVGNLELVTLGPLVPEQQARVHAMQVSAEGLLQTINDMLDFSKIDVGELDIYEKPGSIADLLDHIAMSHAPLAVEKGLRFYVVFDRNIPSRLLFDPIRVSQIVNNLLSNAFKFTNSGKIVLKARWADERIHITVVDSGIGIPAGLREQLFEPFTQETSNRLAQARGTGLGLSICARLCELMKGTIELESTVGVGTRIGVALPLERSATNRQTAEWTLPSVRATVLCRAPEYQTWLGNLFDPESTTLTMITDMREPIDPAMHGFLLVTDEYPANDVLSWWRTSQTIIWATQAGPLVPVRRCDGGVEISVYSLAGLRTATQMIDGTARHPPAEKRDGVAGATSVAHRARPLSVLIAEDNLLNRGLLRDQLTTLGTRVIEAARGDEMLALFAKESVDVVFTDIDMPGMNGYEVLEKLRARDPSIPVFAVSASARPEEVAEGRARGFTDYLTKPVPLAVLATALDAAGQPVSPVSDLASAPATAIPDVPIVRDEFAQAFVEQTQADLAELATVVSARSVTQLRQWLHRVSGGISVLGTSRLLDRCRQLQTLLHGRGEWSDDIEQQALAIGDVLAEMRTQVIRTDPATVPGYMDTASTEVSGSPPENPPNPAP